VISTKHVSDTSKALLGQEDQSACNLSLMFANALQVKQLDADLVEAQGSHAASSAADELRGLLEGSKRTGTMKGSESEALPAAFNTVAQVRLASWLVVCGVTFVLVSAFLLLVARWGRRGI
jgi:hypothetical protein